MIITTGRATKRIEELQAGVKEYVANIALGATTPPLTLRPLSMPPSPPPTSPASSSRKPCDASTAPSSRCPGILGMQGRRKTRLRPRPQGARGNSQAQAPRHRRDRAARLRPEAIRIRVVCSKGTYIRALARDIGLALNSGAHLTALRRTRVGDVSLADCVPSTRPPQSSPRLRSNSPTTGNHLRNNNNTS